MTPRTLVAAVEHAAAHADQKKGFRVLGDDAESAFFSFAALERASARHGGGLQALGLRPGDRVALVLPDPAEFLLAFLGAQRAGLVPVPLYPPLVTGSLAAYTDGLIATVRQSGARFVITSRILRPMLGAVALGAPAVRGVLSIDAIADGPELRPVLVEPEDVALLQYTSGSVGNPKGVIVTHENLAANAKAIAERGLGLGADDVGVSWLPLYHDMGLVGFAVTPIFAHVPVVLMSPMSFLKRPIAWLRAISRYRGTVSYAPTFAYALAHKRLRPADLDGLELSCWRIAGCGAEPIRKAPLMEFAAAFAPAGFDRRAFVPSYGLAEATLAVTFAPLGRGLVTDVVSGKALADEGVALPVDPAHPDAVELVRCGHAFPEHEVGVFAQRGETPLDERIVGEIRVRGPSVTRGYVDGPNAHEGGWLRTGDLGYHVDGELVICGRSKEVIIINGRNVFPQDVEAAAERVAGVRRGNTVAFGTRGPGGDRERLVVAFEQEPGAPRDVGARVRESVASLLGLAVDHAVPLPTGALPKTSSGKLKRLAAKRLFERDELEAHRRSKEPALVDWGKELLRSQVGYLVSRVGRAGGEHA